MNLIAETAWHHDGDFEFLKNLTSTLANNTKAEFLKFHITLDINEYVHSDHPAYQWMVDRVFSEEQWTEVLNIAIKANKKLMLLFNDTKAIEFGMTFNPDLVEIHSACLNDINLLNKLRSELTDGVKIVLGVGGSTLYEIENAMTVINSEDVVLMHGFQNFPTDYKDINFNKIQKIIQLYPTLEHGYADHTSWDHKDNILITLFGASLGMDYIEKHVTTNYGEERVDWQAAINVEMFNDLTEKINLLKACQGDGLLKLNEGEEAYSVFGSIKKAAILSNDIEQRSELKTSDFTFKRTGQQSDLSQLDAMSKVGQKIKKSLTKGHCLLIEDFE